MQALEAAEFGDMLPKLTSELQCVFHMLSCLSTQLISIPLAYRSHVKKNPPKPNAAKPALNSSANGKARVPQPKSGTAVATKGPASAGGGETRVEAESGIEPKGEEEAFSEADILDEEGDQDGNQDEQDLDEDEDAGGEGEGEDEDEDENDPGNTGNDEEMQVDDEDARSTSQSPQ